MLLTSRRFGLLYFCLAGMEIAWITPFFLLLYRPLADTSPLVIFVGLFGVLLVFMLLTHRPVNRPAHFSNLL